ncbi:unnamed protein product, partial [Choristocarpus tenellus]
MPSSVRSNAVLCVKGEIHNVLSVLRLNSRWASRERFTREIPLQAESPLARAFKGLHSYLEEVDDLANVDTVRYLLPFLAVVESPATTGPMTGAALSSLHKFLLYGFIRRDCPRAKEGITLVAQAISKCQFEETDPDSDEVVLMKLLELSALCLRCEVGSLMPGESSFKIFQRCYDINTQDRASGLLRETAGNTLAHVVLMLFSMSRTSSLSSTRSRARVDGQWRGGSGGIRSKGRSRKAGSTVDRGKETGFSISVDEHGLGGGNNQQEEERLSGQKGEAGEGEVGLSQTSADRNLVVVEDGIHSRHQGVQSERDEVDFFDGRRMESAVEEEGEMEDEEEEEDEEGVEPWPSMDSVEDLVEYGERIGGRSGGDFGHRVAGMDRQRYLNRRGKGKRFYLGYGEDDVE